MKAAHDNESEALKEAAVLRSLADAVASPVVAGRKSRMPLTAKKKSQWGQIADRVSTHGVKWAELKPMTLACAWQRECKFAGIGTGLLGWFLWNWAFPLLFELAKLWIESRKQGQDSDR
jgi:hypothetical protein